jgi:hypothetical protein
MTAVRNNHASVVEQLGRATDCKRFLLQGDSKAGEEDVLLVNRQTNDGDTALHLAFRSAKLGPAFEKTVRALVEHKANIRQENKAGRTPLMEACYNTGLDMSARRRLFVTFEGRVLDAIEGGCLIPDLAYRVYEYWCGIDGIFSTRTAFAAKMLDGSVVTWGCADWGGDSSTVQAELKRGVDTIYSTHGAFAAKMLDGSVVTWGNAWRNADYGGDSSTVQAELKQGVDTIYSTAGAFAAKMLDGSVVTWGNADLGGDSSAVQTELSKFQI